MFKDFFFNFFQCYNDLLVIETSNLCKNNGVSSFLLVNLGKSNNSLVFFTLANSKIDQITLFLNELIQLSGF